MAAADSRALQDTVAIGQEAALVQQLRRFKAREDLDFINLRKPDGRLVATDHGIAADAACAQTRGTDDPHRLATA